MRTRLKALVTWGVLALASGCGGQVVVDPGSGSGDDISGGVCEAYCDLVHTATDVCRISDICVKDCIHAFTTANEDGCPEEMTAIYECWSEGFKKSGRCHGAPCGDEWSAYNSCRPQDGNHD